VYWKGTESNDAVVVLLENLGYLKQGVLKKEIILVSSIFSLKTKK
jgi:hypothetical protein